MRTLPVHLRKLLLALAVAAPALPAAAQNPVPLRTQAGYYRLALGDFIITALSDGTTPLPVGKLLVNIPPAQIGPLLARQYLSDSVVTSINAYLIDTGTKRLLVDTGAGALFGPNGGHLLASLRAAGYQPAQIDAVLLTHIHADHSGGLVQSGQLAFPNADVYVDQREADFWLTAANRAQVPASHVHTFDEAEKTVRPVVAAGKLKPFRGGAVLFPGVRAVPSPGHGPGHSFFVVESKGQKLVFWGDVVHAAAVQFPVPTAAVTYDADPAAAAEQRRLAFAEAAQGGYLVAGDHISFPGIGHVRAEGGQYQWVPIPFRYEAK